MRIEFIETAEKVDELLPTLYDMVADGLIEVQDTTVIKAAGQQAEPQGQNTCQGDASCRFHVRLRSKDGGGPGARHLRAGEAEEVGKARHRLRCLLHQNLQRRVGDDRFAVGIRQHIADVLGDQGEPGATLARESRSA